MATITPPPPTPPPPPTAAPASALQLVIAKAPPALAHQTVGSRISAQVVSQSPQGQVQIQTPAGLLEGYSPLPLARGAELLLSLTAVAPNLQLRLLAVDGLPPHLAFKLPSTSAAAAARPGAPGPQGLAHQGAPGSMTSGAPSPSGGFATASSIGTVPPVIGGTTVVTATLLRPLPFLTAGLAQPGVGAAPLVGQSQGSNAAPPTPGVVADSGAGRATTSHATNPGVQPSVTTTLAAGTRLPVRVIGFSPPAGASPPASGAITAQPSPLALGQPLRGSVTGLTPAGEPVIRFPGGAFSLATTTAIPRGSTLTVEVAGQPLPGLGRPDAAPPSLPPLAALANRSWPALNEAVQVLRDADPAAAQRLLNQLLPRADSRLAASILNFLSSVRGGDIRSWLGGDVTQALARARPDLLNRLGEEFRRVAAVRDDPATGDWRVTATPLFSDGSITQVHVITRRFGGGEEDEEEAAQKGKRFIVDVALSRLGRLQLDGLYRDGGKRLDMIVRSERPLPKHMREDIRTIFHDAGEMTGVQGGIGFQAAPPGFIDAVPGGSTTVSRI